MRTMGVDLGSKRIGIALSDADGLIASPLTVIHRRGGRQDLQEIADLAKDYEAGEILVGLPVDLRGEVGPAARAIQKEIEQLRQLTDLPVIVQDERLTSAAANRAMANGGLDSRRRRQVVDKVAAALLLQSYLDAARHDRSPRTPDDPDEEA